MAEFIVYGLPRSRTAWLSKFLSPSPRLVGHDIAADCASIEQFVGELARLDGTCETGAMIGWKLLRQAFPDMRVLVVRRPIHEVVNSLAAFGIVGVEDELVMRDQILQAIEQAPGTLSVEFSDLIHFVTCKQVFEHCLGIALQRDWWESWHNVNVQVNMVDQITKLQQNQLALQAFREEVVAAVRVLGGASCLGLN